MSNLLWLIPGGPLAGALVIILFGGRLAATKLGWIAVGGAAVAFLAVVVQWFSGVAGDGPLKQTLYPWMAVGPWQASIGLSVDRLALVMVTVVSAVGLLIHLFSVGFMAEDSGQRRYFFFLNLFLTGMLVLVLADNLLLLYLGWEAVGLCSYALIGFWFGDINNAAAGRKAFTVTRIGDTAFAIAIFLLFAQYHTLSFSELFTADHSFQGQQFIALLVLLAALGKSAQLPLHVWLPDAMAGPSPVSALIHAATMVTAGVYLILRMQPLFVAVPEIQLLIAYVGAVTVVYGASSALGQHDFKRVLAYSTISQIGYMFLALGCGAYAIALFHLFTHAFFKALLFLCAGTVIHAAGGERRMIELGKKLQSPVWIKWVFLTGAISLAAVPLVGAGFYSKDAVLTAAWLADHGPWLWALGSLGALLTGAYIFRAYLLVFHAPVKAKLPCVAIPWSMSLPLLLLACLSLTVGWLEFPHNWPGPHLWSTWLANELGEVHVPVATTAANLLLVNSLVPLLGIVLAFAWVHMERTGRVIAFTRVLQAGWGFDALYRILFVRPYFALARSLELTIEAIAIEGGLTKLARSFLALAQICNRGFERTVFEGAIRAMQYGFLKAHSLLSTSQNGLLSRYATMVALGAVMLLAYWLWGA